MSISTDFAQAIQDKFNADPKELSNQFPNQFQPLSFSVMPGKVYDRIVSERPGDGYSRKVHAFIKPATGELIKASGWSAPAKRRDGSTLSKFNLSTPEGYHEAVAAADVFGGYLYST